MHSIAVHTFSKHMICKFEYIIGVNEHLLHV
jgi:hypothetical protein